MHGRVEPVLRAGKDVGAENVSVGRRRRVAAGDLMIDVPLTRKMRVGSRKITGLRY
jgi:hypothetical protein